jgi:hypothetical protein
LLISLALPLCPSLAIFGGDDGYVDCHLARRTTVFNLAPAVAGYVTATSSRCCGQASKDRQPRWGRVEASFFVRHGCSSACPPAGAGIRHVCDS